MLDARLRPETGSSKTRNAPSVLAKPDIPDETTDARQQIQDLKAAEADMQLTPDDETASVPVASDELGLYALLTQNRQQKQYGVR